MRFGELHAIASEIRRFQLGFDILRVVMFAVTALRSMLQLVVVRPVYVKSIFRHINSLPGLLAVVCKC